MPAFPPDKESSLLNKLYETAPWTAKLHKKESDSGNANEEVTTAGSGDGAVHNGISEPNIGTSITVDPLIATSKCVRVCVCARVCVRVC